MIYILIDSEQISDWRWAPDDGIEFEIPIAHITIKGAYSTLEAAQRASGEGDWYQCDAPWMWNNQAKISAYGHTMWSTRPERFLVIECILDKTPD